MSNGWTVLNGLVGKTWRKQILEVAKVGSKHGEWYGYLSSLQVHEGIAYRQELGPKMDGDPFDHGEYDNLSTNGFGDGGYSNYLEFTTMGYRGSKVWDGPNRRNLLVRVWLKKSGDLDVTSELRGLIRPDLLYIFCSGPSYIVGGSPRSAKLWSQTVTSAPSSWLTSGLRKYKRPFSFTWLIAETPMATTGYRKFLVSVPTFKVLATFMVNSPKSCSVSSRLKSGPWKTGSQGYRFLQSFQVPFQALQGFPWLGNGPMGAPRFRHVPTPFRKYGRCQCVTIFLLVE